MEAKTSRYGRLNTWDAMKLLALAFMFTDHLGYFFLQDTMVLRAIGRGAIPIFLFLTGFAPVQRFKPDLLLLAAGLWALNLAEGGGVVPLGILGTILIGRGLCRLLDTGRLRLQRPYEWLAGMVLFMLPSYYLFMDGTLALMFVLCGYMQQHAETYSSRMRLLCLVFVFAFETLWDCMAFQFNPADMLVVMTMMAFTGTLLWRFRVHTLTLPAAFAWAEPALRLLSRYTLWIYALHFSAGQLITGKHY